MKQITFTVQIQFDADDSNRTAEQQMLDAVDAINGVLQREPYGLGAQLITETASNPQIEEI